jgi:hypothetical protein
MNLIKRIKEIAEEELTDYDVSKFYIRLCLIN